ncbi:uncharacterized protein [Mytilus edulis]|uniref:uncharacterized protein n=1 Tax=Mytilus edulis TaxID=6550 RepID=UPI0039EEC7A7
MSVFETDSVRVDTTIPKVKWLKVGTLVAGEEEDVAGYVWQASKKGIKAAWSAKDPESGIIGYEVAVGTTPGGTDKLAWTLYGAENDVFIQGFCLSIIGGTDKLAWTLYCAENDVFIQGFCLSIIGGTDKLAWTLYGAENDVFIQGFCPSIIGGTDKLAWTLYGAENDVFIQGFCPSIIGGTDKLAWTLYGAENDVFIQGLSLDITNLTTYQPGYYVSLKATNEALLISSSITSTPIVVVDEDKAGLIVDGADGTDETSTEVGVDVDYTIDTTTVTVQFDQFESHLHGVMMYEWSVGTTPGGEEVRPFMSEGIIHSEEKNVAGDEEEKVAE